MSSRFFATTAAFALLAFSPAAYADDEVQLLKQHIKLLEARLEALETKRTAAPAAAAPAKLDERLAIVERKQELAEEDAKAKTAKLANVEMGKKGLAITSADKQFALKLRGYAQLDNHTFVNDNGNTGRNEFVARRLRPVLEVTAFKDFSLRLMPDFAGTTRIFDAHADYRYADGLQFRVGKFKPPVGLERLQSAADTFFIERGLPTNFVPTRDFGAMIYGDLFSQSLEYQLGIFNGTSDLGNNDNDNDDKKDVTARLFATPFRNSDTLALQGFGIGVGGSFGQREGSTASTALGDYRSPGQQAVFRYRTSTATPAQNAFADGSHWRLSPQGYYYYNQFGLLAEYVLSSQEVTRLGIQDRLQHTGWQVAGSYVLTGEDASFKGGVKPRADFDPRAGGWGALEAVARAGGADFDDDAFPNFADITASVTKETSYGLGLNWYLNENLKLAVNYDFTTFDGGAATGDRPEEHAIFTRTQFRF